MNKPTITKTYGPIHFEDLDPHRFEDLIRELIYDYKDWQSIEATGRSGNDEGFDIRAYEKLELTELVDTEEDYEVSEIHPMEGNLWMIQGKREKEIGPKKIRSILAEINKEDPPYGYILAASANFSKDSYDTFREELRKKGIMEFYLWGKAELEDMLHLPKNDRILFTFFGISLVSKRRSRTTEIRSAVSVKNKLYKAVGAGGRNFNQSVLLRDLNDIHYPYEDKYKDFQSRPRWKEYIAFRHHPRGLFVHTHKYYAYVDTDKKEWDYTDNIDLIRCQVERDTEIPDKIKLIDDIWDFFPKAKQGYFVTDSLVQYSDIAIVDDKGDVQYAFPHLYVPFSKENGPFHGYLQFFEVEHKEIDFTNEYKRIDVFPDKFSKEKIGTYHKDKLIVFDQQSLENFKRNSNFSAIYDSGNKYIFLAVRDIIAVDGAGDDEFIQITHKFKTKINNYLENISDMDLAKHHIEMQLKRQVCGDEEITVYEFRRISKWRFENDLN